MTIFQQIQLILKKLEILKKLQYLLGLQEKNYEAFAEALGKRESGGNYQAVNLLGYLGKWQFGLARLTDLGLCERKPNTTGFSNKDFVWKQGYSEAYFLNTPDLQNRVFKQHVEGLLVHINTYFASYFDTRINGVLITPSGCVASAHLSGLGGVKKFLESGYDPADANGTRLSAYMKEFGGYLLDL